MYITTLKAEMKKALLISIPLLMVTGVISVVSVNHAVSSVPVSTPYPSLEPLRQNIETVEPVITTNEIEPVYTPPDAPVEVISSNEDLKVSYGWNISPYSTAIDAMIQNYPQFFTDQLRAASFEYLKNSSPPVADGGITYFFIAMRAKGYTVQAWIEQGKRSGQDTSIYE